jgi:uncharacterized membrane protein YfcA
LSSAVLALAIGLAVGLSLGLVGGGGSVLAVPLLVYVLDEDVKQATTTSLLVVGVIALVGAADHARAGRVRARIALALALAGAAGSIAGTAANRVADDDAILLVFALVLLAAAGAMIRGRPGGRPEGARGRTPWAAVAAAGLAIGALTGFLGVGGGFLVVPLLVLLFGLAMPEAIGTSLLVIALVSSAGFAAHIATGEVDWPVAGALAAGGTAGALAGSRLGERLGGRRLELAFAGLLVVVAAFLLGESLAGLVL